MAELVPDARLLLRDDLSKEYYAILGVVSSYDGWLLIVKGWSVTLSLAALGLGFQQRHFALFALAAVTGAAFWYMDGLMKGYQYRYYVRMREIEYTAYLINRVVVGGEYGQRAISAPRIDMTWPSPVIPGSRSRVTAGMPGSLRLMRATGAPMNPGGRGLPKSQAVFSQVRVP